MKSSAIKKIMDFHKVSNAGNDAIESEIPVTVAVTIFGTSPLLFHRWQTEEVEAKAAAKKGSAAKKTDNLEAYIYRNPKGIICIPGEYLRGALIDPKNGAAKYRQDPRSPRKSALDLYRAGIISLTPLAPIIGADGSLAESWDFVDARRVTIQRQGITRRRPGFQEGWKAEFLLLIQTPNLIAPNDLHAALIDAGRLVGIGDFRPSFGRFSIIHFEPQALSN